MQRRTLLIAVAATGTPTLVLAHHGWSSFDQERPIYIEGKVTGLRWQNPHAELDIEVAPGLKLPADLASRALPAQSAPVDGKALLARATVPTRKEKVWEIELAPLTRMEAWKVEPPGRGDTVSILGFTTPKEEGEAVVRAEYLWVGGRVYGMRSSPA